jgi:phosphate transport system protein
LVRLLDLGLERLKNMLIDMGNFSEQTVSTAIDAYTQNKDLVKEVYAASERLRMLEEEVSELAIELLARYQPVASDLRFIKSCLEIAYGFTRFGRYAYDIMQVRSIFGDLSHCDTKPIEEAGKHAKDMIRLGIKAFIERDINLAKKLKEMDSVIDNLYLSYVKAAAESKDRDIKCAIAATLILRYLERIADHATYIADSIEYIKSGKKAPRRAIG